MSDRKPGEDNYPYFTDNGLNQCPWCGEDMHLGGGGPKEGPWITENGTEVDYHTEVGPNTKCYCPDCYTEKMAEKNSAENASLGDFGGDS